MSAQGLPTLPNLGEKRKSVWEKITNIMEESDASVQKFIQNAQEAVSKSSGFRTGAMATKQQQDRILAMYKRIVLEMLQKDVVENNADNDHDHILWPANQHALHNQCKMFLTMIVEMIPGREGTITYQTLSRYRMCLVFWARQAYAKRGETLDNAALMNALTEGMAYIFATTTMKMKLSTNQTQLGLPEMRILMELDMLAGNVKMWEQHHLAWCFGRTCALRPGSLARNGKTLSKDDHLQWRDIKIARQSQYGHFQIEVTIRNLKTNFIDPEKALQKVGHTNTLTLNILSPSDPQLLPYSVPHRLLVVALRRKMLDGINDLDQLMSGNIRRIMIKDKNLDDPVFLQGTPKGASLLDTPMTAKALTYYVKDRARKAGFTEDVTFYSFRRRTSNDLVEALGRDAARLVMNHRPDSNTLENYYEDGVERSDLAAVALGEAPRTFRPISQKKDLASTALPDDVRRQIFGPGRPALKSLVNAIMATHPPPACEDRVSYKTRVQRNAVKVLIQQEAQLVERRQTLEDYEKGPDRAETVSMASRIMQAARDAMRNDSSVEGEPPLALDADLFGSNENGDTLEPDIENQHGTITRQTDEITGEEAETDTVPYEVAARAFMGMLLRGSFSEDDEKRVAEDGVQEQGIKCQLCVEDPTVPEDMKVKLWRTTHLPRHAEGHFHTRYSQWKRKFTQEHENNGGGRWTCPYCAGTGAEYTSSSLNLLIRHIMNNTIPGVHDALKRADGWNDADWTKQERVRTKRAPEDYSQQNKIKRLRTAGLEYPRTPAHLPLDSPVSHPNFPDIVLGSGISDDIPPHLKDVIAPVPEPCTRRQDRSAIAYTPAYPPGVDESIPAHLAHLIVPAPRQYTEFQKSILRTIPNHLTQLIQEVDTSGRSASRKK